MVSQEAILPSFRFASDIMAYCGRLWPSLSVDGMLIVVTHFDVFRSSSKGWTRVDVRSMTRGISAPPSQLLTTTAVLR
ncbi:hypothetical protein KC324_g31 [Hortaea werneckii]|nr:hypothetical protein KC324_g31 [Hortaea werneckii]